jgi:tRNA modification GTPase
MRPDRIVAVATPAGVGAISIVRLSGPALPEVLRDLLGREALVPRRATFCAFLDRQRETIDEGLAIYFPAPHSYTGEDVLELHGHGGPAVQAAVLRRCLEFARMAEPGEFTRRAYLNGRIDLVQAEAVADLIQSGSEAAARAALRSLEGHFSSELNGLSEQITQLRVLVEACLDFPEEDVELLTQRGGLERLAAIDRQLQRVLSAAQSGRLLREGAKVVLCGQPNVGKSTLLNRLAGSDVAIVTDVPGTTRDVLRESVYIRGVPLQILDTAGLRDTQDIVEKIGVQRTWESLSGADLAVLMVDARQGVTAADRAILAGLPVSLPVLTLANKADLVAGVEIPGVLAVSARTGAGLEALESAILAMIGWQPPEAAVYSARERHLRALRESKDHLQEASAQLHSLELLAEELRQAHEALSSVTQPVTADELLGQIFQNFCIGK